MPRRVLVIGEYGIRNGGENSFLCIASTLLQSGWDLIAAVPSPSEFADALRTKGIPTRALSFQNGGQRKSQARIREEIADLIDRVQPDIIHCNSLSTSRLGGPIAREKNIPGIGYLRDIIKLSRQAIGDINDLDRIIAVSQATKDWHCQSGIESNKTFVVFNGVDTETFCPLPGSDNVATRTVFATSPLKAVPAEEIPVAGPKLLFVGQIGMRKGVDILLKAFLLVAKQIPEAQLLIVGDRHSLKREAIEFEQTLIDRASASPFHRQIHWLGRRNDVAPWMQSATLLIHPARQEPLGRVLLEAAACGLPILTTRVGGSPEILTEPGLTELLVEPENVDELAGKIICLLESPDQQKIVGQRLRELALRQFSILRCAEQLDWHYHQLLQA